MGRWGRNSLSSHTPKQWSLVSSTGLDIFLDSVLASCGTLAPSGCLHAANRSPLPGIWHLKPDPQFPDSTHHGGWADKYLRLVSAGWHWSSVWETLHFALCTLLLRSPPWLRSTPPAPSWSLSLKGLPSGCKLLLLHSSLPDVQVPSLFYCLCLFFFFFCPTQLCEDFIAIWEVWGLLPVFNRCSIGILPHVVEFLMNLWEKGDLHLLLFHHLEVLF